MMARHASTFRQNDLTRAVKGAVAAGVKIAQVEIDKDGKIILIAENGDRQPIKPANEGVNEWDSVLK
jgi:hypothetical protein